MVKARKDLRGKKFGILKVIEQTEDYIKPSGEHCAKWLCECECGITVSIVGYNLTGGYSKSCGCAQLRGSIEANSTHRSSYTRLYRIWSSMKKRCYSIKYRDYKNYGGKGIIVCDEWKNDFAAFKNWAINNGYSDTLSIDRKDNNGNYEPSNCRWSNNIEQANNTTRNIKLAYNGVTHTISEWSRIREIPYSTLYSRIFRYKWDLEKAFKADRRNQ